MRRSRKPPKPSPTRVKRARGVAGVQRVHALLLVAVASASSTWWSSARGDEAYRPPEYGYSYGEIEGPRTLAMGGAARGWGWSTSSIASNPANLAAQRVYHAEGLFGMDTRAHRLQFGGAVMDSVTGRLAMGVLAARTVQGNDADTYKRGSIDARVAAAYPLSDSVSFGVVGRYLRITQDGVGPLGQGPVSRSDGSDSNFRVITFDAGLSLAPTPGLRIGVVGNNLTSTGSALAPLAVGGGLGYRTGELTIEADVVGVDRVSWGAWKTRVSAGVELLVADRYPLRVGYLYDQGTQRHAVSGGVGFVDRQFAIDASLRQEVSASQDPWGRALVFVLGVRYFYDPGVGEAGAQ